MCLDYFRLIHRIFVAETNAEIVACVLMSKQIKLWGGKVNVTSQENLGTICYMRLVNLSVDFKLFKMVRCSLSLIPKMAMCYICNIVQKI